jgi:hypothetical protein
MILDKKVMVKIGGRNVKYFQSMGYSIPKEIDRRKRVVTPKKTSILVDIQDLPPTASVKVLVRCEDCGIERKVQYGSIFFRRSQSYQKTGETLCSNCANTRMSGKNSGAYKHGNILFPQYRNNARRRGIHFNLTVEQFEALIPSTCFYCGDKSGGIDRWKSEIGYEFENCVPCCSECNFLKNNTDPDVFIKRIGNMYETLKKKGLL